MNNYNIFFIKKSEINEEMYKKEENDLIVETIVNIEEHSKNISNGEMIKTNLQAIKFLKEILFK